MSFSYWVMLLCLLLWSFQYVGRGYFMLFHLEFSDYLYAFIVKYFHNFSKQLLSQSQCNVLLDA